MDGVEDMVEVWAKPQLLLRVMRPQCQRRQSVVRGGIMNEKETRCGLLLDCCCLPRELLMPKFDVNTQRHRNNV
jgi:hypothetical protein